jgi:hypothetical protein
VFSSLVLQTAAAKKKEKKPIMLCASSGHINKLEQSIFAPSVSMGLTNKNGENFS